MIKKLFSEGGFAMLSMLALQAFNLLTFMVLTRVMPEALIGEWALFLTFVSIADMTRQGLLQNGLVRFIIGVKDGSNATPSAHSEYRNLLTTALLLNTLTALSLGIVVFGITFFTQNIFGMSTMPKLAAWFVVGTLLQSTLRLSEAVQIAHRDFKGIFAANLLNGGLPFVFTLIFVVTQTPITLMMLLFFQFIGASMGLFFVFLFRKKYFQLGNFSRKWWNELVNFGKYVAGTNLFSQIFQRLDTLLIGALLTPSVVAIYNVATRLNNLLDLPINSLALAEYPRITQAHAKGEDLAQTYTKSVAKLIAVQLPMSLLMILLAPLAVQILAGNKYVEAVPLVQLLALAGLVKPWGRVLGITLDAIGKPQRNFILLLLSLVINLILNIWLIPIFGALGAALATSLGTVVTVSIGQYLIFKWLGVRSNSAFKEATLVWKSLKLYKKI